MKTDWFFDADGTGTAFYAWKAWPVVRQACPNRRFLEPRRSASCERAETAFVWDMDAERAENMAALEIAKRDGARIVFCEDGFLKSADTWANGGAPLRYRRGCSVVFDTRTPYFDATRPSDLELALNDPGLAPSQGELDEARRLIARIVGSKLTKYNHQPLDCPYPGRRGCPKVLVVDQSRAGSSSCAEDSGGWRGGRHVKTYMEGREGEANEQKGFRQDGRIGVTAQK